MAGAELDFYDEAALTERLTVGLQRSNQSVVFLLGAPLTAPLTPDMPGVPGVQGVIDLIRAEFGGAQLSEFDRELSQSSNTYQTAFSFLLGRRGQQAANQIIKQAVLKARAPISTNLANSFSFGPHTPDDVYRSLDTDLGGWCLTSGVDAIGGLVARYPAQFGRAVLTTNFDPLLSVAISKAGGVFFRTVLHRDGNLSQTEGTGCHVIHLHGYWYGADTLHTPRQLSQSRPRLKASLNSLLKAKIIVVSAYSGWDDVFTDALMEVALDDNAFPEIIWTFHSPKPEPSRALIEKLTPGIDRGRVNLYSGIDCQTFFPQLLEEWEQLEPTEDPKAKQYHSPTIEIAQTGQIFLDTVDQPSILIEGDKEDRPPQSDLCVGRDSELGQISQTQQRVCFVTGFGGQGKSTVAARYFATAQEAHKFNLYVWRDCKEEGERFENQIIDIIVRLSGGISSANELAQQSMDTLAQLVVKLAEGKSILFVFDNVDHYVDLEQHKLTGNADAFLSAFLRLNERSQLLFTCRPEMNYSDPQILNLGIGGLDLSAAIELFEKRKAPASPAEVREAHTITKGHAFWLDLIAAQTAKNRVRMRDILEQISQGSGTVPASTLSTLRSIWETLHDHQKLVLQTMAETVRPETAMTVGDYLSGKINFNQANRAIKGLRDLNLIVIKPRRGEDDLLELHPLVREFIRRTFPLRERMNFIDSIIRVYLQFMGFHKAEKGSSYRVMEHWTGNAELYIEAGKLDSAFNSLADVSDDFYKSDSPGEFARVARRLFRSINWSNYAEYKNFDAVFSVYFRILLNLGREQEYFELIDRYETTVQAKDVRYINYCRLRCTMYWTRLQFAEAIEWGERGKALKDKSEVDTRWSTDHALALARRDFGQPDIALPTFLTGIPIEEVIDPEEFDEDKDPSFYGNIGRCLHLMGQIDPALICYRKSALLLQRDKKPHVENQGFIRKWIGELVMAKGDFCSAKTFFQAARMKWRFVAPQRALQVDDQLKAIENETKNCIALNNANSERYFLAWINERERYFVHQ